MLAGSKKRIENEEGAIENVYDAATTVEELMPAFEVMESVFDLDDKRLRMACLRIGSLDEKDDITASLVPLAQDNEINRKFIVGGIAPLLKLIKDGTLEGKEATTKAIGILEPEDSEEIGRTHMWNTCCTKP
eukprot:Gb_27549 [translate_table: standard]